MPRIPDMLIKSAVYLYPSVVDAENSESLGGTAFIVAELTPDGTSAYGFLVTNRHVVERGSTVVRTNLKGGQFSCYETDERAWVFHPDGDDLAALFLVPDVRFLDVQILPRQMFLTEEIIKNVDIGPGDEAFMVGRFVSHEGRAQNTPVVRFGNIAQMPHEPIRSKHPSGPFEQWSFLVEARTVPGFSGSPVFVHIPAGSTRPGQTLLESSIKTRGPWLLGVDWAHLNSWETAIDDRGQQLPFKVRANPGMMAVAPAWRLAGLLDGDEMKKRRENWDKTVKDARPPPAVTMDSAAASETDEAKFLRTVRNLLDTPHKPHKPKDAGGS